MSKMKLEAGAACIEFEPAGDDVVVLSKVDCAAPATDWLRMALRLNGYAFQVHEEHEWEVREDIACARDWSDATVRPLKTRAGVSLLICEPDDTDSDDALEVLLSSDMDLRLRARIAAGECAGMAQLAKLGNELEALSLRINRAALGICSADVIQRHYGLKK